MQVYRGLMRRTWGILLLVLALSATAAPAVAQTKTTRDPRGGGSSLLDIHRVKVTNNAKGVRITVTIDPVDWVTSSPLGDFRMLIDTRKGGGAEFAEAFGMPGDGGFSARHGSKRFKKSWRTYPSVGRCGRTVAESWDVQKGVITVHIRPKKGCLYHPKLVRVNVRTQQSGYYEGTTFHPNDPPLVDHLPASGAYTPWVRYTRR